MIIKTVYMRMLERFGAYVGDEPIDIEAEVFQHGDTLTVELTPACEEMLAAYGLDDDELIGAREAIEEKFWSLEEEACRVLKVRQQLGTEAA